MAIKLGEFVGNGEPEFEGAVEGAVAIQADTGDSPLDDFLQAVVILGGSRRFESKEGGAQAFVSVEDDVGVADLKWVEDAAAGDVGAEAGEVIGIHRRHQLGLRVCSQPGW